MLKALRDILVSISIAVFLFSCNGKVKEPEVAGTFYPQDRNSLASMVRGFLEKAEAQDEKPITAIISPHAGYEFSGHVAAYGYKQLQGSGIKTVILIGASHHHSFKGVSVYTEGSFKTPLGNVRIDEKIAKSIINESINVGFYPEVYKKEHSLEVQLPFLQMVIKDFKIVPILMGSPTRESFEHLSLKLKEIMSQNKHAILIASTDLSHYHDYDAAVSMDRKMTDAIERLSIGNAESLLMHGEAEMCGAYPVILTIKVSRELGATHGVLYKYANSGDVTPHKDRVVGYASIGIYKSALTEDDKKELLSIAKKTITEYVSTGKILEIETKNPKLRADRAVFVTINMNDRLRGCIGSLQAVMPLDKSVIRNAIAASSMDPRFPPMKKEDLNDMDVEISILSPLETLQDVQDIVIGRDGLYIIKDGRTGVLLPQVPLELGWDRDTFLKQVSLKAGLPEDAWKTAALYKFTAEVIKGH